MFLQITIIFIALLLSAFFSGVEMAYVSANKLRIELDKKKGLLSGKILSFFNNDSSFFIASILVGNNISLVVYGIFMAGLIQQLFFQVMPDFLHINEMALLISQTIISTFIILITAEFLPKNLFRINPNNILNFFSVIILGFYVFLYPLTYIAIKVSDFVIVYLLRLKLTEKRYVFSPIDIDLYLEEFASHKDVNMNMKKDIQIFQNARDLPNIKIRECMVPRLEIIAVEQNDSIDFLKNKFIENGLSKVLVFESHIDNIIGYVHTFDMFKFPNDVRSIIRPITIVPESMTADALLKMFIQDNKSVAVVVDEFGGTSGIITIEDLVEEIFGEINDEYDFDELIEKKVSSFEYVFSGRLEIDYINEKYELNLPVADEYETLAGLIINEHKSIPRKGEEISIRPFLFVVNEVSETRIEKVTLKISE